MNDKKLKIIILKNIKDNPQDWNMKIKGVDDEKIIDQIRYLDTNNYFLNSPLYADNTVYIISHVKLSEKGKDYIINNSLIGKLKSIAKELWKKISF